MTTKPDSELRQLQRAFTEHLRNPDEVPVPAGLDQRRMGVYQELIFGNLSALLADFFPVIHSILDKEQWHHLVRSFFITHQAQTPYFPKIAEEFIDYLNDRQLAADEPEFLIELAHYEWVELALYTSCDEPPADNLTAFQLRHAPLSLSPIAAPLVYSYPVHQISPDFQPSAPGDQPSCLLVFRDRNDAIRFFELQPLAYQFLEALSQQPGLVAGDWLTTTAREAGIESPADFIDGGLNLLSQFNEHGLFLSP